jgi:hypothetical protein
MANQATKKLKSETNISMECELKLSEIRNRFRVRSGEIEIEYEGPLSEVNKRFDEAKAWLANQLATTSVKKKDTLASGKEDKRGGVRKAIYPPYIDRLKKDGFFKPKKSIDEIIKKFESMGVPTKSKKNAIVTALRADTRKKNSSLKGTKEGKTWLFWED